MAQTGIRNSMTSTPLDDCTTIERWREANGYDPKTRKYRDTKAKAGAVPGAHPGAHKPSNRMRVG